MPTYEYRCDHCEHELEIFQSITESPKKKCPACGKLKLKRLLGTGAGVIFKGSGFYETDYRSESYKKAAASETPAADKTTDKKETKTESKTPAKTDSRPAAKDNTKKSG